jgi:hypothetical protein
VEALLRSGLCVVFGLVGLFAKLLELIRKAVKLLVYLLPSFAASGQTFEQEQGRYPNNHKGEHNLKDRNLTHHLLSLATFVYCKSIALTASQLPVVLRDLLKGYKRLDFVCAELVSAGQVGQFDKEGNCGDFAAYFFYEPAGCGHGSAGCQQVVDHQDLCAGAYRIGVYFQRIGAVFQIVGDAFGLVGQFAFFADGYESGLQSLGDHGTEYETSGLYGGDIFNAGVGKAGAQGVYGGGECLGVGQ